MKTWAYKIETQGKELRSLINGEKTVVNAMKIMHQIVSCLDAIEDRLLKGDKATWKDMLSSFRVDINEEIELFDPESYEQAEETVNFWLAEFYDLCDSINCWVGI